MFIKKKKKKVCIFFKCFPLLEIKEEKKNEKKKCANRFGLLAKLYCDLVFLAKVCIARERLKGWKKKLYCNIGNCIAMRLASRLRNCIAGYCIVLQYMECSGFKIVLQYSLVGSRCIAIEELGC